MRSTTLLTSLLVFFASIVGAQVQTIPAIKNASVPSSTLIRTVDAEFNRFQRDNEPFVINNTSDGYGMFAWQILDLETKAPVLISYDRSPVIPPLDQGQYVVYGQVQGLNDSPVGRLFINQQITVLPELKTEGEATRVVSLGTGNNIIDASAWSPGETVFLKKSGATVGRIRIDDYNSAASKAHIIIDPSSVMEVNAFSGSHGLWLVNCQGLIIDAVGTTDAFGLYLNGVGDNTSHGLVLNTTSDIRCADIDIYGVKIEVPQVGASGFRMLGDESATYNRSDPPLVGFRLGHIWVVEAGHEGMYLGVSVEGGGGFGGPRKFDDVWAWDWRIDTSGRDAMQFGGIMNGRFYNWTINGSATLGEGSHNSYIVHNEGNEDCKIFNVRCKGGVAGISLQFGDTGTNPMIWNIVIEVPAGGSFSTWNFTKTGDAPNTDIMMANITFVALTGDEIVYRFDSSTGTQDITDFSLINTTTIKGTSANFFTKDGSNPETGWDITSGKLLYTPATAANAQLDNTTHLPALITSPSITGGVPWTTRRTLDEMLGDFGTLEIQYDIDGYVVGLDGEYPSGAGSGMELKLAAL